MKTINLVIFGIGNVGSTLINQIESFKNKLKSEQQIDIKIPVIANSTLAFYKDELEAEWQVNFQKFSEPYTVSEIINYVTSKKLQNTIAIDATASEAFVQNYTLLVENDFHIVAANKTANTLNYKFYKELRDVLNRKNKQFYYETNVGAGLPVIETVRNLKLSGEKISRIRGVFSGSLSYIFNRYSDEAIEFSEVLLSALTQGFTEPDARDDLSGKDVARKLLILGRELGLQNDLASVNIQSLVPKTLNGKTTLPQFKRRIKELNSPFQIEKDKQNENSVLRYIGELDLENNTLDVKLISEFKNTPLGQLKGTDTLFEIYTKTYSTRPLVIQGAGAGKEVTARGLLSDVVKIAKTIA